MSKLVLALCAAALMSGLFAADDALAYRCRVFSVDANCGTGSGPVVSWVADNFCDGSSAPYTVQRKIGGGNFVTIATGITTGTYTDSGPIISPGTVKLTYRVICETCDVGEYGDSNQISCP